jgi:hypothetical protein
MKEVTIRDLVVTTLRTDAAGVRRYPRAVLELEAPGGVSAMVTLPTEALEDMGGQIQAGVLRCELVLRILS